MKRQIGSFLRVVAVTLGVLGAAVLGGSSASAQGDGTIPGASPKSSAEANAAAILAFMLMPNPEHIDGAQQGAIEPAACSPGTFPTRDGYCVPSGVNYCGGGRYCQSGHCMADGRCCAYTSHLTADGYCIPSGVNYCGGGRWCQTNTFCACGGTRCVPLGVVPRC